MAIRTHYDNLQVARDASTEAIRAAYRELVQQYAANHSPSAEANRLMKTIHNSYSILSNPIQKNKYDQWLLEQEPAHAGLKKTGNDKPAIAAGEQRARDNPGRTAGTPVLKLVTGEADPAFETDPPPTGRHWPWYVAAGGLAALAVVWLMSAGGAGQDPTQSDAGAAVRQAPVASAVAATDDIPVLDASAGADIDTSSKPADGPSDVGGFIGSWRGVNDPDGVRQTLEIKPKSDNSFAFRLDSKAGADIGGITGVARLENGQARFSSREYGCSMVFGLGNGGLSLETRDCRAFYRNRAVFDGRYMRPESIAAASPAGRTVKPKAAEPVAVATSPATTAPSVAPAPAAPAKPVVRLRKYSVSVQDAEGAVTQIELLAKDKNAARRIVRDFRGNPKVLKIKEVRD